MKTLLASLLTMLTISCLSQTGKDLKSTMKKHYLVSADTITTITAAQLKQDYAQVSMFIKNGYTAYRILYNTTMPQGKAVVASGALLVPDVKGALPLLNYDHGTYFPSHERNAPSYFQHGAELGIGKLFCGVGYLVVMPDYIGYGATKDLQHPYGAYHLIANSVIDMLYAVKEFCNKNDITLSGKNFFSGWSEGAAVAVATVKDLEENYKGEFTPAATVVNAGPYYSSGFVNYILDSAKTLTYMSSYIWILQSYNRIYNINKPNDYYFTEPAATDLKSGPEAYVTHDPQKLFTETFKKNYKEGKDSVLQNAMLANDLWNWKPLSKIVFCHGDKDDYVPIFNSEKAYETMKAKGADVTLKVFKGGTHSSGAYNFIMQAFTTFESMK